jgi:hypothetical protein
MKCESDPRIDRGDKLLPSAEIMQAKISHNDISIQGFDIPPMPLLTYIEVHKKSKGEKDGRNMS